jgi:hypothetical protein
LLAPEAHNQIRFTLTRNLLNIQGYETIRSDVNYTIAVTDRPLRDGMRETQTQRLKKCKREGLTAAEMPLTELENVHTLIAASGAAKGFALSMTAEQIYAMAKAIPNSIVLYGVHDKTNMVAAGICVRLSPEILYIFMVGDKKDYQSYSPVVMLVDHIYAYCQTHAIKLLDYGIAATDSGPNIGLMDFKRRLGFEESLKIRMQKVL